MKIKFIRKPMSVTSPPNKLIIKNGLIPTLSTRAPKFEAKKFNKIGSKIWTS